MRIAWIHKTPVVNLSILLLYLGTIFLGISKDLYADTIPHRTYETQKLSTETPVIDGVLNDDAWNTVEWSGDFVQREPYEGEEPSQKTVFKILYDDNNLYVAIKAFDTEVDKIDKRVTRRDEFEGDMVVIQIDSYFDKLTAYSFVVTAGGVKCDEHITNEDNTDDTWNPVWYVKTSIDYDGWYAEMKIPLTQLRFAKQRPKQNR